MAASARRKRLRPLTMRRSRNTCVGGKESKKASCSTPVAGKKAETPVLPGQGKIEKKEKRTPEPQRVHQNREKRCDVTRYRGKRNEKEKKALYRSGLQQAEQEKNTGLSEADQRRRGETPKPRRSVFFKGGKKRKKTHSHSPDEGRDITKKKRKSEFPAIYASAGR